MKNLMLIAVLLLSVSFNTYAQNATEKSQLNQVLQSYYGVKDALVQGNSKVAAESAADFIKNLNGISYKIISEGNVNTLLKDAGTIADAKNIDKQRAAFSNFSTNMAEVAKSVKLSTEPVYLQYCPMKKASWLSNAKEIKNPYYGSSMLSCGKVTETIQ